MRWIHARFLIVSFHFPNARQRPGSGLSTIIKYFRINLRMRENTIRPLSRIIDTLDGDSLAARKESSGELDRKSG